MSFSKTTGTPCSKPTFSVSMHAHQVMCIEIMEIKMTTKQFGNLRKLASGRVQARYRLPNGEQISAGTFDTAQLAQNRLDEIEVDLRRGSHWDGRKGKTKFRDFMSDYMDHRSQTISAGELANNRSYLKVHLLPTFGNLRMEQIDEECVDKWFAAQRPSETRRNVFAFLRRAMKYAVKWGFVRISPCNVLHSATGVSNPRPTWTIEDFQHVLEFVPQTVRLNGGAATRVYYREALEILFAGHLRLGELIGLNASDYDRKKRLLKVERQVTGLGLTTNTKTGNHKVVRLLAPGSAAIERLPASIGSAPLLPGARSNRMPRLSLQRTWVRAVDAAGMENFHLHDIRHIGLSLVAESGAAMREVMARGGHASLQSAMRYQHTTAEQDRRVVDDVDRLNGWA
jgi:integrase